ncbi:hypothetical protein B0T21DRAFT_350541 [Apiosordaria backusii]|uniref:Uncharacterized protein n=1 Tax=Apiosordaria backusii TaxID=314023 RepID=A0AA40B2I5_9PEZI|nr:hypothetical protein B0T21DRAFT_350541 [Apiosordaria backusii]
MVKKERERNKFKRVKEDSGYTQRRSRQKSQINFLASAFQAIGAAVGQTATTHGPGVVEGAKNLTEEAIKTIQREGPGITAAAANIAHEIGRNAQEHGPAVAAAAMDTVSQASKHVGDQFPLVMEHVAAAAKGAEMLTEAARQDLEKNHPEILDGISKGAVTVIETAEKAKCWAAENPGKAAIIVGGVVLVAAPGVVTSPVLAATGFGEGGVVAGEMIAPSPFIGGKLTLCYAGSVAASVHSGIRVVAAGSLFSILQSAGAGGAGAAAVGGAVQGVGVAAVAGGIVANLWEAEKRQKSQL